MPVVFDSFRRRLRPEGVDAALWAYATSDRLAQEESAYFADDPLCMVDLAWVESVLGDGPGLLADLGCGSGRAAKRMAGRGWDVLAIDLSLPMLKQLQVENDLLVRHTGPGTILPVQANLSRFGFLPEASLDAAICLFSTLGMMRTPKARQQFLSGVSAALKPGGSFLMHAHNWWVQRTSTQGRRWLVRDTFRRLAGSDEFGNRDARYRGIPGVSIHMFTWPEIVGQLGKAGLRVVHSRNLDAATASDIGNGYFTRRIRAGGWLIEAKKG